MSLGLSPNPPQRNFSPLVIPNHRPVYRIKEGKFFGPDDCLRLEGEIIAFDEEPNMEMEPLNELALAKYKAFLAKLDNEGKKVAEKAGKSYNSLEDAFENSRALMVQDSKRVEMITTKEMVPLMGAKKKSGKVERIEPEQAAPLMSSPGKRPRLSDLPPASGKDLVNGSAS